MTSAQYRAELTRLLTTTEELDASRTEAIPDLIKSIPRVWQVQIDDRKFEISTEWLRSDLEMLRRKFDPDLREQIDQHLERLQADLDQFQQQRLEVADQRARLSSILARPEFHDVHGPGLIDRIKEKIYAFLFRLLERAFRSSAIPTIGKVLVYGLAGLAVLALGLWVYRTLRAGAAVESILPEDLPVSAKEWSLWMAEAREASARGQWRDAVHLAYWAGISFLEARGTWRPDRARTPREYLRLLPSYSEFQAPLAALTRGFEVVWYGYREADATAFSQTLQELEKLGCR
jgi:hypothetical protein